MTGETPHQGRTASAVAPAGADSVSEAEYRLAMRRVISPVAVITSATGAERNGLTVTAICSATTEPPTLLVCVNNEARALRLIEESGRFAVNFLSDEQSELARVFSTRGLAGETRLQLGSWTTLATGAPVLNDCVSAFDCEMTSNIPCGTHRVILGRVVALSSSDDNALLYRDGFFRRIAPE